MIEAVATALVFDTITRNAVASNFCKADRRYWTFGIECSDINPASITFPSVLELFRISSIYLFLFFLCHFDNWWLVFLPANLTNLLSFHALPSTAAFAYRSKIGTTIPVPCIPGAGILSVGTIGPIIPVDVAGKQCTHRIPIPGSVLVGICSLLGALSDGCLYL